MAINDEEICSITCNRCNKYVAKSQKSLILHQRNKDCVEIYKLKKGQQKICDNSSTDSDNKFTIYNSITFHLYHRYNC